MPTKKKTKNAVKTKSGQQQSLEECSPQPPTPPKDTPSVSPSAPPPRDDSPETSGPTPDTEIKEEVTQEVSTSKSSSEDGPSLTEEKTHPLKDPQSPKAKSTSTKTTPKDATKKTTPAHSKSLASGPRRSGRSRTKKKPEGPPKAVQTQVTDYYPLRRSTRKCKTLIESERFEEIATKLLSKCEDDLEIITDDIKGRGVVSTIRRRKGDFICEYSGELISYEEAKKREEEYSQDSDTGCYMYYFEHKNTKHCVDATKDNGRLGRLLNHSRTSANVTTKLYEVDGSPFLCLMALKDIEPGEELLYDYGERKKEAIESHPWLTA